MGTALTTLQKEIQARLALASASLPPPKSNAIKIDGKRFKFPDGTASDKPINVVILDWRWVNRYYTQAYDRNAGYTPPACWARGFDPKTLAPDSTVANPIHSSCKGCPKDEWGSGGGKRKACKNELIMAVVPPDAGPDTQPWTLKVSPTALDGFSRMVGRLARGDGEKLPMDPVQIVTYVAFDPNQTYPTLIFKEGEEHNNLENCWRLKEAAQAILDRPLDD